MTEAEIMKDYQNAMNEEYEAQQKNTEDVLTSLSKKVDANYLQAVKDWLGDEDNGIWGNLKIVYNTIGDWQDEVNEYEESYWDILKGMYVNQSCGYSGDDYNGTLEVKISETEYLRASFSL